MSTKPPTQAYQAFKFSGYVLLKVAFIQPFKFSQSTDPEHSNKMAVNFTWCIGLGYFTVSKKTNDKP
jgi:hypothetical protein